MSKLEQKKAVVILAAGKGRRFGKGIKALQPIGPSGETFLEYTVYDAIQAGFDKIILVIRKEAELAFQNLYTRIAGQAEVALVYVEENRFTEGIAFASTRREPWGTAHSLLCAKEEIQGPFIVANADDYYGKESFSTLLAFLSNNAWAENDVQELAMVTYRLENTLSFYGGVTRGVCVFDRRGEVIQIRETKGLILDKTTNMICDSDGDRFETGTQTSMNLWGMFPEIMELLLDEFKAFAGSEYVQTAELTLPMAVNRLLETGRIRVTALRSVEQWTGITYQNDVPDAQKKMRELAERGTYKSPLFLS